jgi:hypothetical protein
MHGVIFLELERYLTQQLGKQGWQEAKQEADVAGRIVVPVASYPDHEFTALLRAAAVRLGKPERLVLEEFGIFIAPQLLKTYRFLVKNEWTLLDVLANVEQVMHAAVRRRTPLSEPPRLAIERPSKSEVLIVYSSPRKLCEFARGLVEGLAQFFDETVHISELSCMHERATACRILVTKR